MTGAQHLVWFDLPVLNLARAIKFYDAVTGWKAKEQFPGVAVFEHRDTVLGGCLFVSPEAKPSQEGVLLYFRVDGRHESAEATVVEQGGTVLSPKHAIGPFGFRSLVLDPDGNRIALHSEAVAA